MIGFAYFPAIIYRDERPDLAENILPEVLKQLEQARDSNYSMFQTSHLSNNPAFQEVANYILLSSVELLRNQGYSVDKYDFYLSGLWAQEINRGMGTDVHLHKNSQMCGWFFLETPPGGAYPVYYDSRSNKNMVELDFIQGEEISNATNNIHFNNMIPGTVLFASSWMQHQLTGSSADSPTRCLHFIVSHKERTCSTC